MTDGICFRPNQSHSEAEDANMSCASFESFSSSTVQTEGADSGGRERFLAGRDYLRDLEGRSVLPDGYKGKSNGIPLGIFAVAGVTGTTVGLIATPAVGLAVGGAILLSGCSDTDNPKGKTDSSAEPVCNKNSDCNPPVTVCKEGTCQPPKPCNDDEDCEGENVNTQCDDALGVCRENTTSIEICDGLDNNEDGKIDIDPQTGEKISKPCGGRSVGICRPGAQHCDAEKNSAQEHWSDCTGVVPKKNEQCNGLDDDCDGLTDEDLPECGLHVPVLNPIGDKIIDEGQRLRFVLSAVDADDNPLTYFASHLPEGARFDPVDRVFDWTPSFEQADVYSDIHFGVSDGITTTGEDITITVQNVNRRCVMSPIPDQTVDENESLVVTVNASDPDVDDTLIFSGDNLPAGATVNSSTGKLNWRPTLTQAGAYRDIGITATDGDMSCNQHFDVAVINANRPPVMDAISNQTINENQLLTVTPRASDPDGQTLNFSGNNLPRGAVVNPTTGVLTWTPGFDQAGSYPNVGITASDGSLSVTQRFSITVNNGNRPPVMEAIPNRTINENQLLTITPRASDPDGQTLNFSGNNLPRGAAVNSTTGVLTWTPGFDQAGTYPNVGITASDENLSVTQRFSITVNNVNSPPILNSIGNRTVNEGGLLTFTVFASDPDGDALTYSASNLPTGSSFNVSTRVFSWTPNCRQAGAYPVSFSVTDRGTPNLSDSENVMVTVNEACSNVAWTRTYNGSFNGRDIGHGIAVDNNGNVYVTGSEEATELNYNIWVRKYDANGNTLWTRTYNGSANSTDEGRGIAVDNNGNVYVTGSEIVAGQRSNVWVRKYDTNGNALWTETYNNPANSSDEGHGIAVDNNGNVYVAGDENVAVQYANIWVRKYDANGNALWTKTYNNPANGPDMGQGIAVDNVGNVYVTGFEDADEESFNIWIRKYDANGNTLWTRTHNANWGDFGNGIAVDGNGNVYVTGSETVVAGNDNIWIRKYDTNGNTLWTETHNGSANNLDSGNGITIDRNGNVYVTGFEAVAGGGGNVWVRKYDTDGNTLWTETHNGGVGQGIAVDINGNVYVTGQENGDIWVRKYVP
ncbi:MAG: putative Ig domain-containing protein [Deltaproteobacteria bacterium]|nr:putative Ig domain-containing protein [Deltaproteobacteria bacterium]